MEFCFWFKGLLVYFNDIFFSNAPSLTCVFAILAVLWIIIVLVYIWNVTLSQNQFQYDKKEWNFMHNWNKSHWWNESLINQTSYFVKYPKVNSSRSSFVESTYMWRILGMCAEFRVSCPTIWIAVPNPCLMKLRQMLLLDSVLPSLTVSIMLHLKDKYLIGRIVNIVYLWRY